MSSRVPSLPSRSSWPASLPFYYGWVNVVVASVAMTATLPGRTHGLGLITEPLLRDLRMGHTAFAWINLAATLIGAAFCIPTGRLIDRYGVRSVLVGVSLALGLCVVGMSRCVGPASLAVALVLVRGFGQSALSVASMAAVGKWFNTRAGAAMGVFAVLLTVGFIASVISIGEAIRLWGWRSAWQSLGFAILALVPIFGLVVRSTPESVGVRPDALAAASVTGAVRDFTLREALTTSAFWAVTLGSSAFNLIWSGVTLFNESMLAERGLGPEDAVQNMAILTGVGLFANLVAGKLATREHAVRLLGGALLLLAVGLASYPLIDGPTGAQLYAVAMGLSGGVVTVVFFAAWGHLFGRSHLGRIQGAAQLATVLASASGPLIVTEGFDRTGSYTPVMFGLSAVAGLLALVSFTSAPPP